MTAPVTDLRIMGALRELADELMHAHGGPPAPGLLDLAPGLAGENRAAVFAFLGLDLPEDYARDLTGHARVGEGNHALTVLAGLSDAVDAAWNGDDEGLHASLVLVGADVVRWLTAVAQRLAQAGR